jgi:GNAT superfamily N-acetyltransferase
VTTIRPYRPDDADAVLDVSLRAWSEVHESFRRIMGDEVFGALYGSDWQVRQGREVRHALSLEDSETWVAEEHGTVVGFATAVLRPDEGLGAIWLLAVEPGQQDRGIGTTLAEIATRWIEGSGLPVAAVSTGGDPAHAAARRVYEKVGYTPVPAVNYFKAL